jgi:hypothetical protein
MTRFLSEQNKTNPKGRGDFNRVEFDMMGRVFDGVRRNASIPRENLGFYQRLAWKILDVNQMKPTEAKLRAAALRFARNKSK